MREVWDEANYKFQRVDKYPYPAKQPRRIPWKFITVVIILVGWVCLS